MKKIILLSILLCFALVISVSAQTWTSQTSGVTTSLTSVSVVDVNVGWIAGYGGVVLRTSNGGTTWTNVTGAPIGTQDLYAIYAIDANICMVTSSPGATFVYRTSNAGATWTQVFTQAGGFINDFRFKDANTGFMYGDPVGSRWSLWKTTNGGVNWDSTGCYLPQAATEAGWNNAMFSQGNNIWFGTNNTRVYKSTNWGATGSWTFGATTGSANSYSVAFNNLIGFTGQTAALKSIDGGATYSSVTLPGTGTIFNINAIQNLGKFWYARGSVIYASTDNGTSFTSQYTGTGTYQAMHLKLSGTTIRGWATTSAGGIARFDHQNAVGVSQIGTTVPEKYSLNQNYPNPFNPVTNINFALPKSGMVSLKVYDALGHEISTVLNEYKNAGNYNVIFSGYELSSGVFYYKLEAGDFSAVKKMILVK